MTTEMRCPRRYLAGEQIDHWTDDNTCSYCGSLKPETFMQMVRDGVEITPTDKNYKVYVGGTKKFYFQHLNTAQRKAFIELFNARKVKMGDPGYFYVAPFFCTVSEKEVSA